MSDSPHLAVNADPSSRLRGDGLRVHLWALIARERADGDLLSGERLPRLIAAADNRHPVTITYVKADGTETLRTIEIFDVHTTKAGDVAGRAVDRDSREARTFRVDRIRSYTTHRSAFTVPRPVSETPTVPAPAARTAEELTAREIARDDREYWTDRYDSVA